MSVSRGRKGCFEMLIDCDRDWSSDMVVCAYVNDTKESYPCPLSDEAIQCRM